MAVKLLRPDLGSEISRERLRREVRAARPGHPNVVTVFDLHEDSGRVFLSMELVSGRSLRDELADRERLPWHEVVGIGQQIAAGLAHLHAKGLVHRDVKPGNILISRDGTAKICYMGLARPVSQGATVTETAMVVGTPAYMAPEQARAGDLTAASDIYALGLTLYRVLTGSVPREGTTAVETLMIRQKARPPRVRSSKTPCPRWLDRLIRRMLEPEAGDRPDAKAVTIAFENGTFGRSPSKRVLRRSVAFTATALVIVAAGWGVWRQWRAPRLDPATALRFTARQFTNETTIEIADTDGNVLQEVQLGKRWGPAEFGDHAQRQVAFGDFNGDGRVDAAVAISSDKEGGKVAFFLRHQDGTLEQAAEHFAGLQFQYGQETFTDFRINDMIAADLDGDNHSEIILVEASSPYYPSAVEVIDWENEPRFTLWHPGILRSVQTADRNDDGRPELYLGGTCNFLTPPESNTSAPIFLAVEADWKRQTQEVNLFAPGRRLASSTPPGVRIHYASWPRVDIPEFHAAWQDVLVQRRPRGVQSYLFSLIVTLQDRAAPTRGTGRRKGIRHALIGFDLEQIDTLWEPTVAKSLGIDPADPAMQALLKPRYWDGRSWQEESCFMASSQERVDPGS